MAGKARRYHDRFKFLVEIDGFVRAGFQKAGPLEANVEKIEYREGGALLPDKSAGGASFEDITLEYGATDSLEDYAWFSQVLDAATQTGGADPSEYKRDLAIIQLDRAGREVQRWNVYGAWPVRFRAGDWDNTATTEKTIRQLVLTYDYFEPA